MKLSQKLWTCYGLIGLLSFLESFLSPISPLWVMIPACIKQPTHGHRFVILATVCSTLGAIVGYYLGLNLIYFVMEWIEKFNLAAELNEAEQAFATYGAIALFVSSITFIPFKLFTITSGMLKYPFIPFLIYTIIARYLHFILVPFGIGSLRQVFRKIWCVLISH